MSLPLGKVTILLGAGILGSLLAQEGRMPKFSDLFSGAFKIVFKQIQRDDSQPTGKPKNNSILLAQVDSLRQELQMLASSRSVTIITKSKAGATSYGLPIIVIGVAGYGYIWWKGWKLSDMMFATRRSLSDACATVGKQLEQVQSSLWHAKKHLSSRIELVDKNLDECKQITADTKDEVALLRGDLTVVGVDVQSVYRVVQKLETRIGRIDGKQDLTNQGVLHLCEFVENLEQQQQRRADSIQASPSSSSRPAIEFPKSKSASRTESLPPTILALEPSSSPTFSNEPAKSLHPIHTASSASGLKELEGISSAIEAMDPEVPNGSLAAPSSSSSSGSFGWKFPGLNASFLTRTCSATLNFKY